MSLKNKLNRLKKHMVREEEPTSSQPIQEVINDSPWKDYQIDTYLYDNQQCLIREVTYPLDYQHGLYKLGDFKKVVEMWNKSDSEHPLSCKGHQVSDLFFFDTETTGLGGGVGNTIFLLGQAQVFVDRVVIKQHLLPGPGNEVALYQSFLQGINSKTLVTYNGKAFDWPQLKTRHTLIRESVPSLPPFGHFDLFHAARRLWKNDLDSVRLANVEKEILQIERENDVPGFLAPMIYFQFVKQQQPEIIYGVLKHNEIDVLSLITLYTHLSFKLLKTNDKASEGEHYEIARWLDYIGDEKSAFHTYQSLIEKGGPNETTVKYQIAQHYKKQRNWSLAVSTWKDVIDNSADSSIISKSAIELAKYYEHKEKKYEQAIYYTNIAYEKLNNDHPRSLQELKKRIVRLEGKSSQNITRGSAKNE